MSSMCMRTSFGTAGVKRYVRHEYDENSFVNNVARRKNYAMASSACPSDRLHCVSLCF